MAGDSLLQVHRQRIVLVALAVVAAACTSSGDTTPTTVPPDASTTTEAPSTTAPTTAPPSQESSTTTVPSTTTLPAGTEDLSPELRREFAELVDVTEDLRELEFLEGVRFRVTDDAGMEAYVRSLFEEETEDVPADDALYTLLGLLGPEDDLLSIVTDFYGEAVIGVYDDDAREMVVTVSGEELTVNERATIVHELVHALTDQHFQSGRYMDELVDGQRYDEAAAYLAVMEGDATLVMANYIRGLPVADQLSWVEEASQADPGAFDETPLFIREDLYFRYERGLTFVQRLDDLGGSEEVGRAYVDPPTSTEQILTPRDYRRDLPIDVELAPIELGGYEVEYDSTWGELGFALMFEQVLGGRDDASDGWGGDRFVAWFDGTDVAFALRYRGDRERDAEEMFDALADYAGSAMAVDEASSEGDAVRFIGDDYGFVSRSGDTVLFLAASDPAVGPLLEAAYSSG